MKISEWILACKSNQELFYWDGGVCSFYSQRSCVRYHLQSGKFSIDFGFRDLFLEDVFITKKQCAIKHIGWVEENYLGGGNETRN